MTTFEKARTFIYRNARPLDLARWQYHFENGSVDAVLNALSYYQNDDGGFGHALEPDSWNPNSSPIATWTATEIINEIKIKEKNHPIIQGILKYLASGKDFAENKWLNTIPTNNDYPHACWWECKDEIGDPSYNPTACLAGFIIKYADKNSDLYNLGYRIAKEAFEDYVVKGLLDDMHTGLCYIRLMEYVEETGKINIIDFPTLKVKLIEQVKSSITKDTAQWETSYICKPSQFFNTKGSIFYEDNKELVDYECEYIVKTQLDDGSWNIPWGWNDYPEQWAISKNWWKGNGILVNLLFLKGMGKLYE